MATRAKSRQEMYFVPSCIWRDGPVLNSRPKLGVKAMRPGAPTKLTRLRMLKEAGLAENVGQKKNRGLRKAPGSYWKWLCEATRTPSRNPAGGLARYAVAEQARKGCLLHHES